MSESRIQPGTIVWYPAKGVGQVSAIGNSPSVLFWADRKSGKTENVPLLSLTPLSGNAPKGKQGNSLESWGKESPLKLVALALSACGGSGKVSDIRGKLDKRAPIGPWGSWWKRIEPKLGNLPMHFGIDENDGDAQYTLRSSLAEAPPDWTEPRVTPADWKKWLEADIHEAPPGRFPTKPVSNALAKWPAKTIEQALFRVIVTAEELSASGDVSAQAAEGWLRAVSQASLRWREVAEPDSRGYQAARVGALLASLARIAGDRTPQDLLLRVGELDGEADAWRWGFVAGMWESFDSDGARDMYFKSSAVLRGQGRSALAREIALAAFGPDYSDRRHSALDRLLEALPESERHQLLGEMIAGATSGIKSGVLDYIAKSRHAAKSQDPAQRLNLLTLAAILLSDGQEQVATQASRELLSALDTPGEYSQAVQALFRDTRARVTEERARIEGQMEERRKTHEAELDSERREQERLRQQVRDLGAEVDSLQDKLREARRSASLPAGDAGR